MELRDYQARAVLADQVPTSGTGGELDAGIIVPLLGLAGEAGELLDEYKKHLRDGKAHRLFREHISDELGDLLWYVSNVASKFGLDLNAIAEANLQKVADRWQSKLRSPLHAFDDGFAEHERLPRHFQVELREVVVDGRVKMRASVDGCQVGNELTDNAYDEDGYRFHDVFHLSYAALLGWSPVTRSILGRKRRSAPMIDEVEDGGRAIAIEEGVSAVVFDYARQHNFLVGVTAVDYHLLRTIKGVTSSLEVSKCSVSDWEAAILEGFRVWRDVTARKGGRLDVDLDRREVVLLED